MLPESSLTRYLPSPGDGLSSFLSDQLPHLAEAIVITVREPLLVLDERLLIRSANPAFYGVFRMAPAEILGVSLLEIGKGLWDVPALRTLLERVVPIDGRVEDFCIEHDFHRIGHRVLLLNARRIEADAGRPHLILLAIEDVTERRAIERRAAAAAAELERSNRELGEFASVASHDLQEPLRKIRTFGGLLAEDCGGALSDLSREYLDRMLDAATRMQALIDDLLAFARVTSRPVPIRPVSLGRVTREVLDDLEDQVTRQGARVTIGDLPTAEADAAQMRQLIQNLLSNALKFHLPGEPPVVRIFDPDAAAGRAPGAPVRFAVQDEGIGFDPKYAEKIFGLFERLHSRGAYEGTGMGLALCRRVVERHGGTIVATSTPGRGATFVVALPAGKVTGGASHA